MTRAAFSGIAQDRAGNGLNGAQITFRAGTEYDSPLASVYAAATGGSPLTQPVATDADGRLRVFVAPGGNYRIEGLSEGGTGVDIWAAPAVVGRQYATRAEAVADVDYDPADGTVITAGGLQYVRSAGATALPGLPGWLPFGAVTTAHFGQHGTGSDRQIILTAYNYVGSLGFGILRVLPGEYTMEAGMSLNQNNVHINATGAVFTAADNINANVISFNGGSEGASGGSFFGFTIDGNRENQTTGSALRIAGWDTLEIHSFKIRNAHNYGIGMQDHVMSRISIHDGTITDTGRDAIDVKDRGVTPGENNTIRRVSISRFGLDPAQTNQAGIDIRGPGWLVEYCSITDWGDAVVANTGFRAREESSNGREAVGATFRKCWSLCNVAISPIVCFDIVARDCSVIDCKTSLGNIGVEVRAPYAKLIGNTCVSANNSGIRSRISSAGEGDFLTATSNVIRGCATAFTVNCKNNTIQGNPIENCVTGILFTSTSANCKAQGNTFADVTTEYTDAGTNNMPFDGIVVAASGGFYRMTPDGALTCWKIHQVDASTAISTTSNVASGWSRSGAISVSFPRQFAAPPVQSIQFRRKGATDRMDVQAVRRASATVNEWEYHLLVNEASLTLGDGYFVELQAQGKWK